MNIKLILASVLCASCVFAQGEDKAEQNGPKEVFRDAHRAAAQEARYRETGGYLDVIPDGPAITIVDARKVPDLVVPTRVKDVVNGMFKLAASNEVVALDEKECPVTQAVEIRKRDKALLVVMLTNYGKDKPALTIFPEERVALVNADKATEFVKGDEANIRLIKECWRGIGFISGAGFANNDASVMQPIGSPLELDTISWQVINPLALNQVNKFLKKYGAQRGRRTTYIRACEEGWAPAPTNDVQKAIWEAAKTNKVEAAAAPAK